jgi:transposase
MKRYVINRDAQMYHVEYQMLKMLIKSNDKKQVERRLKAIKLHMDGKTNTEIADKLDYTRARVGQLIKEYREKGLLEFARHKYGGNNRSLSFAEEAEILKQFDEKVAKGEVVTASMIKKAFDEKRGKDTGRGYIYMLLARHDFRMVMPRSKHPNKASDEDIESSKKLT